MELLLPGSRARRSVDEFAQIVHYQVCAMTPKLLGISPARDPNDQPELAGKSGLDARKRVLDYYGSGWLNPEQLCRDEERIGGGFPGQVLSLDHGSIDSQLEQRFQI